MFDKERFIEECRTALKQRDTHAAIRELVARAVSDPAQLVRALGEPQRAGVETIYKEKSLKGECPLFLSWGSGLGS